MRARLLLLLLVAGCHRTIELGHRELPGFGVDLPRRLETRTSLLDYKIGELALGGMDRGAPLVTMLRWTPGEKLTRDELEAAAAAIASAHPGDKRVVSGVVDGQGREIDTLRNDSPDGVMLMSQLQCGGRNLLFVTLHARDQLELHKRMVASVACHPDLEQEALLHETSVPLSLALPGWHAMSRDENQLMLSSADGASILMLQPSPPEKQELLDALVPMLDKAFAGKIKVGKREGERVPLTGNIDGQVLVGYARMTTCPTASVFELALSSTQTDADAVDAKVKAATCLPPGAKPPVWPDAPKQP